MLKKGIAILLVFLLLFTMIPLTAFAETITDSMETEDEYIYYSDLFYEYTYYLDDLQLHKCHLEAQSAMNAAFYEYLDSPNFVLSSISEHINLTTNIPQLFKDYSDIILDTEFRYNESLDEANIKFVAALLSAKQNTTISDIQDIGKDTKEYNQIIKILGVGSKDYEELNKVIKNLPEIKNVRSISRATDINPVPN